MKRTLLKSYLARHGIVILMGLVLLNHLCQVHQHDLTPWKGGGFGMFSTQDQFDTRFVRYIMADEDAAKDMLPPEYRYLENWVRAMPTQTNLDRLRTALATHHPDVEFQIELWRIRFDAAESVAVAYRSLESSI